MVKEREGGGGENKMFGILFLQVGGGNSGDRYLKMAMSCRYESLCVRQPVISMYGKDPWGNIWEERQDRVILWVQCINCFDSGETHGEGCNYR